MPRFIKFSLGVLERIKDLGFVLHWITRESNTYMKGMTLLVFAPGAVR